MAVDRENSDKIGEAYRSLYAKIYNIALERIHDPHMACDIVNSAFMEAIKHNIWWCAQKPQAQEKYLVGACERLCREYLKSEGKCFYVAYEDGKGGPDHGRGACAQPGEIRLAELRESLYKCMERLEPEERLIIVKKYFENYSTKQLCRLMGISEANVLQKLARARKKLKAVLECRGVTEL